MLICSGTFSALVLSLNSNVWWCLWREVVSSVSSQPQCKAAVTFFHFCVLSNFSWLLVEGLYLQTLLLFTVTQTRTLFWIHATVGWGTPCVHVCLCPFTCWSWLDLSDSVGTPSVSVVVWALMKKQLDDEGWVKCFVCFSDFHVNDVNVLYVQVLGQPGEPLMVDHQDSHSALHLCKHSASSPQQNSRGDFDFNRLLIAACRSEHHPNRKQFGVWCDPQMNFLIFLNISRIIAQKSKATRVNQNEPHLYRYVSIHTPAVSLPVGLWPSSPVVCCRRLVRSTLLLIPLFGLHYVVFALFPEHVGVGPRLCFELVFGSFQVTDLPHRRLKERHIDWIISRRCQDIIKV